MRKTWLFLFLIGLFSTGCSGNAVPTETNETKGRELLTTTLEAWKSGKSVDEFNKSQSIVARDPDWKAGCKLTKYEIAPENERAGVDLLVPVKLSLVKPDGQTQEKKLKFIIGIGAQTIVFRSE